MKRLFAFATLALAALLSSVSAQVPSTDTVVFLSAAAASSSNEEWLGGIGVFTCVGTWNGATVTLQFVGPDGTTLIAAGTNTTLTANGAGLFYWPRGLAQATITNAGGSTSLTCAAYVVRNLVQ